MIYAYLIFINVIGFFIMILDKKRAIKNQWRISEKALMGIAAAGGSLGVLLAMKTARHKTKHKKFTMGVPAIIVVQIVILCLFSRDTDQIINILHQLPELIK